MKLIDKDAVLAEIDKIMAEEITFFRAAFKDGDEEFTSSPMVYTRMKMLRASIDSLEVKKVDLVNGNIDKMKQEEPTPPGIQEESQKKGWLDYGLMIGEIGLHRYNAIRRIKEHKEQFNPPAIPDLYHVSEYYESVGIEKVCCCLQAYSKDFMFTQDEVKEIIEKEMEADKNKTHKGE